MQNMNRRRFFQLFFGLSSLLLFITFVTATRTLVFAQSATATPTPTPPTMGGYFSPRITLTRLPPSPGPIGPLCRGCMETDIAAIIEAIQEKVLDIDVTRNESTWEAEYNNGYPAGTQVQLSLHRMLGDKGILQMMEEGVVTADNTGSIEIQGLLPEQSPGGTFVGFACTLEDCSTQNILNNLNSPAVQVWQFEVEPLVTIDLADLSAFQQPEPAIGFDFALPSGLSRWNTAFQWYKDGDPLPTTNNLFNSLANPYVFMGSNRVELYQQGAFLPVKSNDWLGTQFYANALSPGVYTVDVYANGFYEQTIEIPVGVTP